MRDARAAWKHCGNRCELGRNDKKKGPKWTNGEEHSKGTTVQLRLRHSPAAMHLSKRPYPDAHATTHPTYTLIHKKITLALAPLAPAPPPDVRGHFCGFPTAVSELTALSAEVPGLAVRFFQFSRLLKNFRQLALR